MKISRMAVFLSFLFVIMVGFGIAAIWTVEGITIAGQLGGTACVIGVVIFLIGMMRM